ncbi:S1C family serine protease [Planococcus sp. CAU13]|uniref:S1C family serine protease n=1 Tax=Planococcus sp. CAU13 TaxID=1541197 RepID=UPI0006904DAC|nr:S1C family serine protease [Planococcus sp. CAU13]
MKRSKITEKRQSAAANRVLQALVAVIVILATATGIFLLLQTDESDSTLQDLEKTSFTEREYIDRSPTGTIEKAPETPVEAEEEAASGDESNDDIIVEAPEEDLASMIANAKSHVYTLYTDLEQGSGFLFNNKGDILTSAHVVKDAAYVTVTNSNGQEFNGRVIGISETEDIALVRVPDIAGKEPMEMENGVVPVGTPVFALGSPENIVNTSTEGEITAIGIGFSDEYEYTDLYEMTANIKQGSSGGPLISAESGRILGINSIVLTDNPDIGYAIPVYTVMAQLQEWAENPLPEEEEAVTPDLRGAYFSEELLRSFITDYYTLIPYSLNDEEVAFYEFFLLPGSDGEEKGNSLVEELKKGDRVFQTVEPVIKNVKINEDTATIQAGATFTFQDNADKKLVSISHSHTYTVVIDEYGDYRISSIVNQ